MFFQFALALWQLLQVLAKKRRLDIAVALFRWMLQHGRASEHTYLALLRVCCIFPSQCSLWHVMPNLCPNVCNMALMR